MKIPFSQMTRTLGSAWQHLTRFMVQPPSPTTLKAEDCIYSQKARFYAFLPPVEEARDWLEKLYRMS